MAGKVFVKTHGCQMNEYDSAKMVDVLAAAQGLQAAASAEEADVLLLKPQTYMNVSGRSVARAATFHRIPPERTIVVHDELDLPAHALRLKFGGGDNGHR